MSQALPSLVANTVPLALATNGSLPLMVQAVMLQSRHPFRNALAFMTGYGVVIALVVAIGNSILNGRVQPNRHVDRELSVVNVVAGVGLVLFAIGVRVRHHLRPHGDEEPAIVHRVRGIGPVGAAIAGVLVPTYPPAIAAATVFARSTASSADRVVVLVLFVVLSSLCASVPLLCHVVAPDWTRRHLDRLMAFILRHRMLFAFWVFLLLGLAIIARELAFAWW